VYKTASIEILGCDGELIGKIQDNKLVLPAPVRNSRNYNYSIAKALPVFN
jgi:hypothetical protein